MIRFLKSSILAFLIAAGISSSAQPAVPAKPQKIADGAVFQFGDTYLKLQVWGDNIIRVVSAKDQAFFTNDTPATEVRRKVKTSWKLATDKTTATLSTDKLQARVNLASGAVSFFDAKGRPVLAEKAGGRSITPAEVQGVNTFHVEQQWEPNLDESLYGLGQLQFGTVDIKGYDLDLWQHNTCVVVPLLVSSRGYGIFWDNLSYTRFGDLREWESIPTNCLQDTTGQPGGLTTGTFNSADPERLQNPRFTSDITAARGGRGFGGRVGANWTRWVGEVAAPPPASINFASTRTAASKCGWMANWSLIIGGKTG